jgi:hypothetical protein
MRAHASVRRPMKELKEALRDVIAEVESGSFSDAERFLSLVRDLGTCSLWFFLKLIAGYAGPYNELDDGLHLEMCNFRQSDYCMAPGAHGAAFVPRGFFKSTIMDHGAIAWELTRDPNLTVLLVNAVIDNAMDFKRNIMRTFDSNALVKELFPACAQRSNAPLWNEKIMVMPNRTRYRTEANVTAIGATGAGEGKHYDLLMLDDLAGLEDLDAEHMGNADMAHKVQWFKTNSRSLLRSHKTSRVLMCATRWSLDDPAALVCEDTRLFLGYTLEEFEEKASGTWVVYNRMGVEDGVEVNPSVLTKASLAKQMDDDYWSAMTQSMNRPLKTGLAEFSAMKVRRAFLSWNDREERWYLAKEADNYGKGEEEKLIPLGSCDIVMGVDPAATDKRISSKTSKSAVALWAMDPDGDYTLLFGRKGYYALTDLFREVFAGETAYHGLVRCCVVESNAFQKILKPILDREALERDVALYFKPLPEGGDKDARIRSILGVPLAKGKVYALESEALTFTEEQKVFPQAQWRKDFLDASAKCFAELQRPLSEDDMAAQEEAFFAFRDSADRSLVTGM